MRFGSNLFYLHCTAISIILGSIVANFYWINRVYDKESEIIILRNKVEAVKTMWDLDKKLNKDAYHTDMDDVQRLWDMDERR